MRILHVISPAPLAPRRWSGPRASDEHATPDSAIALLAHLASLRSDLEHHVLVLGSRAAASRAASLGLTIARTVSPALGIPSLALAQLRSVLDEINPDATFEWEGGAINASSLEALHSSPTFHINTLSGSIGHHAASVEEVARIAPPSAVPGPLAAPAGHSRDTLREALSIPRGTLLIALLGDHPAVASATAFASTLGILHCAGIDAMGLLSPGALQHERALRSAAAPGYIPRLITADQPLATLLPACDIALLCPPGEHLRGDPRETALIEGLDASGALGLGVPVFGASTSGLAPLAGDLAEVLLTPDAQPSSLARAVGRSAANPEQGSALARRLTRAVPGSEDGFRRAIGLMDALDAALATVPFLRLSGTPVS